MSPGSTQARICARTHQTDGVLELPPQLLQIADQSLLLPDRPILVGVGEEMLGRPLWTIEKAVCRCVQQAFFDDGSRENLHGMIAEPIGRKVSTKSLTWSKGGVTLGSNLTSPIRQEVSYFYHLVKGSSLWEVGMKPFQLHRFMVLITLAILGLGSTRAQQQDLPQEVIAYADLVLYNGKVLTADDDFTIFEAVAVRDGKFLAVGQNDRIQRMAGPQTRKVDLDGKSVVPGLFDTHLHQAWVGQILKTGSWNIRLRDVDSGIQEIRAVVEKTDPGEWLFFGAPTQNVLVNELRREHLDPISPNNPVVIVSVCNIGVANTLALKAVPPGTGGLVKDPATGEPTGLVTGFALGVLAYDIRPQPQIKEENIQLQKQILRKLNYQGLTTVIGRSQGLTFSILKEVWARGELTMRIRVAHELVRQNPNAEAYLKRMGNLSGFGDAMMKIHGTTVQPGDCISSMGGALTWNAKIREYETDPFGPYGKNYWESWGSDPEHSEWQNIILANRYGWNITSMHTQGDRAASVALDVFEKANQEKPLQGRWAFDHALFRTPENIRRAVELGVIFSIAPKYLFQNNPDSLIYQYGADQVTRLTPVRSMIDAGMKPVIESDIRGEWSAPLWNMEVLITRNDGKGGRTWAPEQSITRQEALWMKTNWAARYSADEKILGTIEVGKLADLVVLGGDYMTVPADQIAELPIELTVVDGKVVYDRGKDGIIRLEFWDGN